MKTFHKALPLEFITFTSTDSATYIKMKNLLLIRRSFSVVGLLFYIFLSPIFSFGVTKTVVSIGNWSNPSIWGPAGVPISGDDVVIPPGITLMIDIGVPSVQNLTNHGTLLLVGSSIAVNILNNLYNNNIINNPGKIYVHNSLYNLDSLTGTGAICIWDTTFNSGSIYGTIDVCDITPPVSPPYIDFNTGIIDASVTYCMAGLCSPAGLSNFSAENKFTIYPNPAQHVFSISTDTKMSKPVEGVILNTMGTTVKSFAEFETQNISVADLASGIYFVRLRGEHDFIMLKLIVE